MKIKLLTLAILITGIFISNDLKSQDFIFSGGAEMVLPFGNLGNLTSFGAGLTVGAEYPVAEQIAATAQFGIDFLSTKSQYIKSAKMIPFQVGAKYYFNEQGKDFYGHFQLGIHSLSVKTEPIAVFGTVISDGGSSSSSNFSFAFGGGTMLNEQFDLSARINIISADGGSSTYLGLRGAYIF